MTRDDVPGELVLMHRGIKSLRDVSLRSDLHVLNVHCNCIARIEGLSHLRKLQHLDLSSNQIRQIQGLSTLANLRTLSLSCNLITKVEGLEKLFNLTVLNLSCNRIRDLSGFLWLHGRSHKISHIDLHNNYVNSLNHLIKCMRGLQCLTSLTMERMGIANPVCHSTGYRETVLQMLPQLTTLDERCISGEEVDPAENNSADLHHLEDVLHNLNSRQCPSSGDQNSVTLLVVTPRIDQALAHYRQRTRSPLKSRSSSAELASSAEELEKAEPDKIRSEVRMKKIEEQVSQILQKVSDTSRRQAPSNVLKAKRDTDPTSESENESGKENKREAVERSRIPTYCRSTLASKSHVNHLKNKPTDRKKKWPSKRLHSIQSDCHRSASWDIGHLKVVGRKAEVVTEKSTYKALVQELDQEKERRWKAEEAEKKLIEQVKELQKNVKEEFDRRSLAVCTTDRLKELILQETNLKERLQAEVQQLRGEIERLTNELNQAKDKEAAHQKAIQALGETLSKMEIETLQQQKIEMKQVWDAELKASASEREVQLLRVSFRQQKEMVKELQQRLALKEEEQRREHQNRVALNGPEFQDAVSKEVAKEKQRQEQHVKYLKATIDMLNQKYKELEDEFRSALTIEGKKFKEVQEGFENAAADRDKHKQALSDLQHKEKEMASLIQSLTSIVKEQKEKMTEITQSNEEAKANLKSRTGELETVLEEDKQKTLEVEALKKENRKLLSQLAAQESVIHELKMERKLQKQELAQQGAYIAQARGDLEAKIDALEKEIEALKNEKEEDSVTIRIKNKIAEDQIETIRKLKEDLQEKDKQIREQHEEEQEAQKRFQVQLDEKADELEELTKELARQKDRKEKLKDLLEEKQVELEDVKKSYSALKQQWHGKGDLIKQLEVRVKEMKENFDIKEKKLIEERNESRETQRIAVEKLQKTEATYKMQLESTLEAYKKELLRLKTEKEKEIQAANEKVYSVEQEMRQLLQETENNKKAMTLLSCFKNALDGFQPDL